MKRRARRLADDEIQRNSGAKMKCEDLMSSSIVSIHPNDTVLQARRLMTGHGVHALAVVDTRDKPLGMLTTTDLLKESVPTLSVSHIMTPRMISIPKSRDVSAAARMMLEYNLHHLIVTAGGRFAGILSALDLLEALDQPDTPKRSSNRPAAPTRRKK